MAQIYFLGSTLYHLYSASMAEGQLPKDNIPLEISIAMGQEKSENVTVKECEGYVANKGDIDNCNEQKY